MEKMFRNILCYLDLSAVGCCFLFSFEADVDVTGSEVTTVGDTSFIVEEGEVTILHNKDDQDSDSYSDKLCAFIYKSLQTPPWKKVPKFSRDAFQKNTPLAWSRRGSKYTVRNWLRSVANKKTRISIRHVGIYVQFKAQQTERLYRSRHDKVQLKLLL